ncbi:MAG: hypothetical protein N2323_00795, partial [candidate division WOR-3 bacterium]|nr:hypothetical protein [candidate division WOR-3 bacterium]
SWYGIAGTFSLAALSVSLCYYFLFITSSLPYIVKYGRVSPFSFFSQIILGTFLYSSFLSAILMIFTYGIFSRAFSTNLSPAMPVTAFLVIGMGGVFYYLLAAAIIFILILIKKVKSVRLVSFFPMMISYALVYLQVFGVADKTIIYTSPFNNIYTLTAYAYLGKPIPFKWGEVIREFQLLHPLNSVIILLVWMIILFLMNIYLMRNIKEIPIEEFRQL